MAKKSSRQEQTRDPIHDEIEELFRQRNQMPAGFRKNFGPASESDLGMDPEGHPLNVYKPDRPEERNY